MKIVLIVVAISLISCAEYAFSSPQSTQDGTGKRGNPDEGRLSPRLQEQARLAREARDRRLGYELEGGRSYSEILIPSPISETQLARYASILQLSEAQNNQFIALWDQYRESEWTYRLESIQPLIDRSGDQSKMQDTVEYLGLFEDRGEAIKQLLGNNENLFENLRTFLTESQIELLPRARDACTRDRWIVFLHAVPGAKVDLSNQLWVFSSAGYDLTPLNAKVFANDLFAYEKAATRLIQDAIDTRIANVLKGGAVKQKMDQVVAAAAEGSISEEQLIEQFNALKQQRMTIHLPRWKAYKRVQELNRQYVDTFAEQLPMESGDMLMQWFRESTYRAVYPDPYDAAPVFLASLSLDHLTTEQTATLQSVYDSFISKRDELSQVMVDEYLKWHDNIESNAGFEDSEYDSYKERMRALQRDRKRNATSSLSVLQSLLSSQQFHRIKSALEQYTKKSEQFESAASARALAGAAWPGSHD